MSIFFIKVVGFYFLPHNYKHKSTHCLNVYISELISNVKYYRSIHWRCSEKKDGLENFSSFAGKHLRWSLFVINL